MKKLLAIFSIISMIFLVSCWKNWEENNNTNQEPIIEEEIVDEEINIDDIYEFENNEENELENWVNTENNETENTNVNTENNATIEIEEEEVSEMTEEEILRDIDALINDIINSTTND